MTIVTGVIVKTWNLYGTAEISIKVFASVHNCTNKHTSLELAFKTYRGLPDKFAYLSDFCLFLLFEIC